MPSNGRVSRRKVLQGGLTAGVIGLAGCASSDDGGSGGEDSYSLTIGCTSSGSSTMRAGQALARALNEHSDFLSVDPQTTDGLIANLYEYDSGEFDSVGVGIHGYSLAMKGEAQFAEEPVETVPHLGSLYTRAHIYFVGVEGSGVKGVSDLREGGVNLYPIQPGFGTRLLTETILKEADLWDQNEIVNVDAGDAAGAVEEGRIDVAAVYDSNAVALAGWCQEIDVRNDLYFLPTDDDQFIQTVENFEGAGGFEYEPSGWQQDMTKLTDKTHTWTLDAGWTFSPDVPAKVSHEICRVQHEHSDTLKESDETSMDYQDLETHMAGGFIEGAPVHDGVANFLEEHDAWKDKWTRGGDEEFKV